MMSEIVLKVENLSKLYRLGEVGTGTISHDLNRWWAKIRGKEDPYTQIGQINDRNKKAESDYVWSLRNINFDVEQGEVLGIVGKNGAGKSTLLKLISQITSPTTGKIKIKGRIAALLEVGTGMNPELTARENIYLNGAILGMTKKEIASKFDEIVDFSGCTMYVDTPVKRFSSGMRVRLGFAVAAFLEPEILIVDEVLAVGDAEFQKKAIGKMKEVSAGGGRTVLFVSHNMIAVKSFCTKAIFLENGEIKKIGQTNEIVDLYMNSLVAKRFNNINAFTSNQLILVQSIEQDIETKDCFIDKAFNIIVTIKVLDNVKNKYHINLFFTDGGEFIYFVINSSTQTFEKGEYKIIFEIPEHFLNNIKYNINMMVIEDSSRCVLTLDSVFTIQPDEIRDSSWKGEYPGIIIPRFINKKVERI